MTLASRPLVERSSGSARAVVALALIGLVLRLGGLFFSGMSDICRMLLEWGSAGRNDGLARAFAIASSVSNGGPGIAVVHLATFRFGPPVLLPQAEILDRYPAARTLVPAIVALPAHQSPDAILRLQGAANRTVEWLPGPVGLALLSAAAFVIACGLVRGLFRRAAIG